MTIDELRQVVELVEERDVAFPRTGSDLADDDIRAAEASLGLTFPPSYVWWLKVYGGGQIGGDVVLGIDKNGIGIPDVVSWNNDSSRLRKLNQLLVCHGNEEQFFLDYSEIENGREVPVLRADALSGIDTLYAGNFLEFLTRRIKET